MKYLCLAYEQEAQLDALSASDWDALRRETLDYVDELRDSGRLVAAHALQSVRTASTVRVREGKPWVTDGPFAETKETLGGFFLIEAKDLDEAIRIATRWPSARLGSIEVRPIEETLRVESRYGGLA
ncbi:MAG: YciI family protein [Methylococcaceae bacterium]|nr:YciI family protein [Methylococcaceae bacterium]